MPSLQALIGMTFLIVLWQGGRPVIERADFARRLDRVLHLHEHSCLADDCAGMGDEYFSARRGVHGPAELHSRPRKPTD